MFVVSPATVGPVFQRVAAAAPWWVVSLLVAFVFAYLAVQFAVAQLAGRAPDAFQLWTTSTRTPGGQVRPGEWLALTCFCAALILVLDGRALLHGFFRFDDFSLLQVARESRRFGEYLRLYHNDHSLPLLRAEVWCVVHLCGASATPALLAGSFNALGFATFLALLLSACWVLVEAGASRFSILSFCVVAWSWPGWGEFTAGFFTLLIYPQIGIVAFCSLALLLHARNRNDPRWATVILPLGLIGAGLDISGIWVLGVATMSAALLLPPSTGHHRALLLLGCIGVTLLAMSYHLVVAPHAFTARELVQNPSGTTLRGSLFRRLLLHASSFPRVFGFGLGGLITSLGVPPFAGIAVQKLSASQRILHAMKALDLGVAVVATSLFAIELRRRIGSQRVVIAALLFAALSFVGMTALARVDGLDLPGALWPMKYKCVPYLFLAAAVICLVDYRIRAVGGPRWLVTITGTAVAGILATTVVQWQAEKTIAWAWLWDAGGRYHNATLAELRRLDFEAFTSAVSHVASRTGRAVLPLPAERFGYRAFPYLEMGSSEHNGSTYLYSDLLAAAPNQRVQIAIVPDSDVPDDIRAALHSEPRLAAVFWDSSNAGPAFP